MNKMFLFCMFLFCSLGAKAQTYCYHCYKYTNYNGVAESRDYYKYITFQDNWLYPSQNASPYVSINGKVEYMAFLYTGRKNADGDLYYGCYDPKERDPYIGDINLPRYNSYYYLVSEDRSMINVVVKGISVSSYELCTDKNCKKGNATTDPIPPMIR